MREELDVPRVLSITQVFASMTSARRPQNNEPTSANERREHIKRAAQGQFLALRMSGLDPTPTLHIEPAGWCFFAIDERGKMEGDAACLERCYGRNKDVAAD